ncbi:hypothetical protein ABTB71_19330, partial [Acinetobacter baumannii]
MILALIAIWGLFYWGIVIGIGLFGAGMKPAGFNQLMIIAIVVAVGVVVGSYWSVARHKARFPN